MNVYKYIDTDRDKLTVWPSSRPDAFLVRADSATGHGAAVRIPRDEAPALALAVLTKSGIEPRKFSPGSDVTAQDAREAAAGWAQVAVRLQEQEAAEQAAREAEDAKVAAYRDALFPNAIKWEHLDEEIRDAHRDRYRAARRFFQDEAIRGTVATVDEVMDAIAHDEHSDTTHDTGDHPKREPRVIRYASELTEEHRAAKWTDRSGDTWSYEDDEWGFVPRNGARWYSMFPCAFPWTEVVS